MRISDWSSDVCSSDLAPETRRKPPLRELRPGRRVAAMFQPNPPAAFACRPDESRGRDLAEPESPTRSCFQRDRDRIRSEEHTSELQSLMRISYAVFCLKKKTKRKNTTQKVQ